MNHAANNGATRRDVVKAITAAGLIGLGCKSGRARTARPALAGDFNILWLMADEHDPFVAGFGGDRLVQTPALDALAAAGTRFTAAYTPDPICVPSRQAFCSGVMASNLNLAVPNYEAFGPFFSRMGLTTGWVGKQGWETMDNHFDYEGESCEQIARQRFADAGLPYPEGTRYIEDASLANWGTDLNVDNVCTEQALGFLDAHAGERFFLGVSYVRPHFPYCIQPEYYLRYASAGIPRPKVTQAMLDDLSTAMKSDRDLFHIDKLTRAQTDFCRAIYYGMVSYIDDQVGRVLARLDALGLRDNTLVLYMSDHGEMLGQHGIWYKNAFLEASARVPMLVSLPRKLGISQQAVVNAPVNTIDLYPTLCDVAGLPGPPSLEGHSLLPLITGADAGTDRVAFSENRRRGIAARMIRTRQYKYCYYDDGVEQLYSMRGAERDIEGTNLAPDPNYADIKRRLKNRALAGWNPDGLFDDEG